MQHGLGCVICVVWRCTPGLRAAWVGMSGISGISGMYRIHGAVDGRQELDSRGREGGKRKPKREERAEGGRGRGGVRRSDEG